MDPVTIIKIIDLSLLAIKGVSDAVNRLNEIKAFSEKLKEEGRDATPEEWDAVLQEALANSDRMDAAIEKLKARDARRAAARQP